VTSADALGVLLLETSYLDIPGAMKHAGTFPFPITTKVVSGATGSAVLGSESVLLTDAYRRAAVEIVDEGASVLTCNCGFAVTFQDTLVEATRRPAVTSSLLFVPLLARLFGPPVAVLTYSVERLDAARRRAAGWPPELEVHLADVERSKAWRALEAPDEPEIDLDAMRVDLLAVVEDLLARAEPSVLVIECTGMFPFVDAIRGASEVPVFDLNDFLRFLVPLTRASRGHMRQVS
jgi:hypothetical protein